MDSTLLATGDDNGEIRVGCDWHESTALLVAWASSLHHSGDICYGDKETQALGYLLDEMFFVLFLVHVFTAVLHFRKEFILELERSISYVCEGADALVICSWFSAVSLRMCYLNSWT